MPISKYFKGHGKEVMREMRKKHGARAEEVFYRTANKKGMKPKSNMPKHGKVKGNWGDISKMRMEENAKAGGFTEGRAPNVAKELPSRPPKVAK